MDELTFIYYLCAGMLGFSYFTYFMTAHVGMKAAYGRYSGYFVIPIYMNAKLSWFLQELPAFLVPMICLAVGPGLQLDNNWTNWIVLGMFLVHYFQRTFIYPFLIQSGKPTPFEMFISAFVFCIYNGYIQGRYHCEFAVFKPNHMLSWIPMLGLLLFVFGLAVNLHSDHILRNLRKPGEAGYKIPRGGMFEYVSGANFFGEIVEWIGYALVAQTPPAWVFAIMTLANIGPRAMHHHSYYLEKFEDYPKNRKAVIPFIL